MPKKLDDCVKQVKKQGKSESEAWAICKDSLKKSNDKSKSKKSKKDSKGKKKNS